MSVATHVAAKFEMQLEKAGREMAVLSVALRIRCVYSYTTCEWRANFCFQSQNEANAWQGRKWLWACLDLVFVVLCYAASCP